MSESRSRRSGLQIAVRAGKRKVVQRRSRSRSRILAQRDSFTKIERGIDKEKAEAESGTRERVADWCSRRGLAVAVEGREWRDRWATQSLVAEGGGSRHVTSRRVAQTPTALRKRRRAAARASRSPYWPWRAAGRSAPT